MLPEYRFDNRKKTVGSFEMEQGGGMHINVNRKLTVQSFYGIEIICGHGFACEIKSFIQIKTRDMLPEAGCVRRCDGMDLFFFLIERAEDDEAQKSREECWIH